MTTTNNKEPRMPVLLSTREDFLLIVRIAERAAPLAIAAGEPYARVELVTVVERCHATNPLRLQDLLDAADDKDFSRDVFGILKHTDRATGKLGGAFVPRYIWKEDGEPR